MQMLVRDGREITLLVLLRAYAIDGRLSISKSALNFDCHMIHRPQKRCDHTFSFFLSL